jgi:hypothetical protein
MVFRVSSTGFVTFDERDGLPASQISSLTVTGNGRPIGYDAGSPGTGRLLFPAFWAPWHQVLAVDSEGDWWTGSAHGLLRFLRRAACKLSTESWPIPRPDTKAVAPEPDTLTMILGALGVAIAWGGRRRYQSSPYSGAAHFRSGGAGHQPTQTAP